MENPDRFNADRVTGRTVRTDGAVGRTDEGADGRACGLACGRAYVDVVRTRDGLKRNAWLLRKREKRLLRSGGKSRPPAGSHSVFNANVSLNHR